MSGAGEVVTDNLLCFLKSAIYDYSEDALFQTAYSFYSHENVKSSKEKLANQQHHLIPHCKRSYKITLEAIGVLSLLTKDRFFL